MYKIVYNYDRIGYLTIIIEKDGENIAEKRIPIEYLGEMSRDKTCELIDYVKEQDPWSGFEGGWDEAWYKWKNYIDGEDANEYLAYTGVNQHDAKRRGAVLDGWTYYKALRTRDIDASKDDIAKIAYAKAVIDHMYLPDTKATYKVLGIIDD